MYICLYLYLVHLFSVDSRCICLNRLVVGFVGSGQGRRGGGGGLVSASNKVWPVRASV